MVIHRLNNILIAMYDISINQRFSKTQLCYNQPINTMNCLGGLQNRNFCSKNYYVTTVKPQVEGTMSGKLGGGGHGGKMCDSLSEMLVQKFFGYCK